MDSNDCSAALSCFDAYIFLRAKSEEALSLLRRNKTREAEEVLSLALSFSRFLYNEACDSYFLAEN